MSNPEDLRLEVNGEIFVPSPENMELYTYRSPNEHLNHVFLIVEETDLIIRGIYVWAHQKAYPQLSDFMRTMEWPRHEDLYRVPKEDVAAYEEEIQDILGDLDERPDWL